MIKDIDIRKANNEVKKIDNKLEYYLSKKEEALTKVLPKSADTTKEVVDGGTREEKYISYASVCEKYDLKIDELYKEKFRLERFITKELKRLEQYDEVQKLIVYYKEIYTPKSRIEKTWEWIAEQVHYSKSQCRNIYKKYKEKRNI